MPRHSILAAMTRSVLDAAAAIGLDAGAVAHEAGLDPVLLADPDGRVALEHHFRVWMILSRQPVGLALGDQLGLAGLGVIGYAMQHGATVGQALEWQQRYTAVVHPEVIPRLDRRSGQQGPEVVLARPVSVPFTRLREPVEAQAAAIVASLRVLTGQAVRPLRVALPLVRPADVTRHERFFRCPIQWAAPELEVAFSAGLLDLPIPRSDSRLFGYLARRADALLAELPDREGAKDRVLREVGAMLASGEPRQSAVARRLAMSERTLSRRLREEGTSFGALVEAVRRERAELLLADRSLSCSEIAFLLGYSEPAAFFRAFKRWTGMTPQGFRKQ